MITFNIATVFHGDFNEPVDNLKGRISKAIQETMEANKRGRVFSARVQRGGCSIFCSTEKDRLYCLPLEDHWHGFDGIQKSVWNQSEDYRNNACLKLANIILGK